MPPSLEERRRAVVAALRAVAAEPESSPQPEPEAKVVVLPMVEALADAMHGRLDDLSARLDEVLSRLGSVETAVLEAAWERPAATAAAVPVEPDDRDDDAAAAVSVPAVDMREGRMSSHAAKALFGH
jgi:hypothetical protein